MKYWLIKVVNFTIIKDFLKINNIGMYSTYNEGKSVVAERFIKTLKNQSFEHMTAIQQNIYFYDLCVR